MNMSTCTFTSGYNLPRSCLTSRQIQFTVCSTAERLLLACVAQTCYACNAFLHVTKTAPPNLRFWLHVHLCESSDRAYAEAVHSHDHRFTYPEVNTSSACCFCASRLAPDAIQRHSAGSSANVYSHDGINFDQLAGIKLSTAQAIYKTSADSCRAFS